MEPTERLRQAMNLEQHLQDDPLTPWWVMDVVRIIGDLVHENDELIQQLKQFYDKVEALEKAYKQLDSRYSELLYRLKSGD